METLMGITGYTLPAGWSVDITPEGIVHQCWRSFIGPDRRIHLHRYDLTTALGLGMLHDVRAALGLGQADVAEACDVTPPSAALWDRGDGTPRGLYHKAFAAWLQTVDPYGSTLWILPESRATLSALAVVLDSDIEAVLQSVLRLNDSYDNRIIQEAWEDPRVERAYAITLIGILDAENYTPEQREERLADVQCKGERCEE